MFSATKPLRQTALGLHVNISNREENGRCVRVELVRYTQETFSLGAIDTTACVGKVAAICHREGGGYAAMFRSGIGERTCIEGTSSVPTSSIGVQHIFMTSTGKQKI